MASQRRSWLARIGVVAMVALGGLVGVTTPAHAAPVNVIGASASPNTIEVSKEVVFKFKLKGAPTSSVTGVVVVSITEGVLNCFENCSPGKVDIEATGESKEEVVKFRGGKAGSTSIRVEGNDVVPGVNTPVTVVAGQQAQTVGVLQGLVKNGADAKPIANAVVTLVDGASKSHTANSDANGIFRFDGPAKKITPGVLALQATKNPFSMVGGVAVTRQVAAGQDMINIELTMENLTLPSATPMATPTSEALPVSSATATPGAINTTDASDDSGLDSMTWVMIIVGGLLVALGIGAIVLLLVRRNNDDDDDDEEEEPARGGPRAPAGGPGGYRRGPPQGYGPPQGGNYGRPADPTQIARPGDYGGVPQQRGPQPNYGQPTQQWGPQQPGYGQQTSGGGYGATQPGYGAQTSGGGYGATQPGYGAQTSGGGYGATQPGYGSYDQQQPGYSGGGQYEEPTQYGPTSGAGGYGQQAGYSQQDAGYSAEPYGGQQAGYTQDPYGTQQPGYDDRRNRGDRRLDWLDD